MKKNLVLVLMLMLVFTFSVSYAAQGDIYNKGNDILYSMPDETDALIEDATDGEQSDDFYKETENGTYKSIDKIDEAKKQAISSLLQTNDVDISSSKNIQKFIKSNIKKVSTSIKKAEESIDEKLPKEIGLGVQVQVEFTDVNFLITPASYFSGTVTAGKEVKLYGESQGNLIATEPIVDGSFQMSQWETDLLGNYKYEILDEDGEVLKEGDPRSIEISDSSDDDSDDQTDKPLEVISIE